MRTNIVDDPRDHVRSFVLRKARMSTGQRYAYEHYFQDYAIPFQKGSNPWETFNESCNRRVLEIGFGMGDATVELARKNPETAYLGIEVHSPGVGRVLSEIVRYELKNLRIIQHDVVSVLRDMIPDHSLDGIHIFFPDPWPKKRHHKRRLIQVSLLTALLHKMKQNGYFYAVTDWKDYARHILLAVESTQGLNNPSRGFCPPREWRPKTAFERKGIQKGHSIYEIYGVKS